MTDESRKILEDPRRWVPAREGMVPIAPGRSGKLGGDGENRDRRTFERERNVRVLRLVASANERRVAVTNPP